MPLLCITLTKHDQEVQLPSEIGSQEAILRMVTYDQFRKKSVNGFPSWEVDLSELLGNSNEIKNSPGVEKAGNTRLALPNANFISPSAHFDKSEASQAMAVLYPNIKFHIGHIRTGGTRIRVYQTNNTGSSVFFSHSDRAEDINEHENDPTDATKQAAAPNYYFREIKLYFEYQTNDHTTSHG